MKNEINGRTVRFNKSVDVHLLIKEVRCSCCGKDYGFDVNLDKDENLTINVHPHTMQHRPPVRIKRKHSFT